MKIVAVYKWARDPEDAAVRADGTVDWRGAKMAAGEDDPAALATALEIAVAAGGKVVGLTLGDGDASWALARGAPETVSVADAPALADNVATAAIVVAAVRCIGDVELVVIGNAEAYPGVAPAVAASLGWPAVLGISSATFAAGRISAVRRVGDERQTLSLGLPAVLGVAAASAEKQAPGMKEVLAARKRPITVRTIADLDISRAVALEPRGSRLPEVGAARIFEGDPATAAQQLVAALRADGVL